MPSKHFVGYLHSPIADDIKNPGSSRLVFTKNQVFIPTDFAGKFTQLNVKDKEYYELKYNPNTDINYRYEVKLKSGGWVKLMVDAENEKLLLKIHKLLPKTFWQKHWKWIITTTVALISAIAALIAILKHN